jgi:hypothetical protein
VTLELSNRAGALSDPEASASTDEDVGSPGSGELADDRDEATDEA